MYSPFFCVRFTEDVFVEEAVDVRLFVAVEELVRFDELPRGGKGSRSFRGSFGLYAILSLRFYIFFT
jgi:hypothetical protein